MSTTDNTLLRNSLNTPLEIESADIDKDIFKPFTYITSIPGKKIRDNLADVFRHWLPIDDDTLKTLKDLSFNIHNTSLMMDDVQDYSELRRGVPAAHKVYGIPKTLVAADWGFSRCIHNLEDLDNYEFQQYIWKLITEAFSGQGMDIYWRDNQICPTEAEYLQMITRKTALALIFLLHAMNIYTTGKKLDGYLLTTAIGVYFQIYDDYHNLHSKVYHDSKGFCEDITEGKYSFPIVHAIRNFPEEGKEIEKILKLHTQDVELKKRCLSILEKCGSLEHTRKVLRDLKSEIYKEFEKFDSNPLMEEFLETAFDLNL